MTQKIIGYGKLGRSWNLDPAKASTVGGDLDVIRLLKRLANAHPNVTWFLIGRNSGENPQSVGYPPNVVNPWADAPDAPRWKLPTVNVNGGEDSIRGPVNKFRELTENLRLDDIVLWAGQHGAANSIIPTTEGNWSKGPFCTPQVSFVNYCSYLLDYCNRKGLEPLWLVPDPRNYIKCRELTMTPKRPVLAQFNFIRDFKQDTGDLESSYPFRLTKHPYVYSGIELTALDDPGDIGMNLGEEDFRQRQPFGVIVNENRREVTNPRAKLLKDWVLARWPDAPVHGNWSEKGCQELGRDILPVPTSQMYNTLRGFRTTVTFPASGSGWVTSKIWECFASGVVCFIHPAYDTQGHSVKRGYGKTFENESPEETAAVEFLHNYLHVRSSHEFYDKVNLVSQDYALWSGLVKAQRLLFERRFNRYYGGARCVEEQLNIRVEQEYQYATP